MSALRRPGCDRARPPGDRRDPAATLVVGALRPPERRVAAVRVDVLPCAVVRRPDDERVLLDPQLADLVDDHADVMVELDERVEVLALAHRLSDEVGVGQVRLVQLRRVQVQEERIVAVGVRVEIVGRVLDRLLVDEGDLRRVELLGLVPLLTRLALHGADHVAPHLHDLGVVEREVGVELRVRVRVGVQVVERRVVHLVEAVRRRHRVVLLAEVPLADLAGVVAGLLEDARDRPLTSRKTAALTGECHRRHPAADRQPTSHRCCPTRRAARLAVEREELESLRGQAVEVRSRRPAVLTTAVTAEVTPADVVGHEQDDVGPACSSVCHGSTPRGRSNHKGWTSAPRVGQRGREATRRRPSSMNPAHAPSGSTAARSAPWVSTEPNGAFQ